MFFMFSHCFSIVFSFTKLLFTLAQLMYSSEWSKIAQIMVRNAWNLLGLTKFMRSHGTLQDILANSDFFGARRPKPNPLLFFGGGNFTSQNLHHKMFVARAHFHWENFLKCSARTENGVFSLRLITIIPQKLSKISS